MRRLILSFLCCTPFAALAQVTDIFVSVLHTSSSAALAVSQGSTISNQIAACASATNNNLAAQGIPVRVNPITSAAVGPPADTAGTTAHVRYLLNDPKPLQTRNGSGGSGGASAQMIVTNPAAGVLGGIPASPPNLAKDAVAVLTMASLCSDYEAAIGRILGAGDGYRARIRRYAYEGSNICFHTRESDPSDPATIVPNLPYWQTSNSTASQAGTPETSCEEFRKILVAANGPASQQTYYSSQVQTSGSNKACNLFSQTGTQTYNQGITYTPSSGSGTVACGVAGDFVLAAWSSVTGNYLGYAIGDATHNSVGAMGDGNRIAMIKQSFPSGNGTLLARAQSSVWASIWNTIKPPGL